MINIFIFIAEVILLFTGVLFAARKGEPFLAAFICLQGLLANLFVVKQIHLFGLDVTAADSFAVGSVMALNIYQELFGKQKAKQISYLSLYAILFTCFVSVLHLAFVPSLYDSSQSAYQMLLGVSPRISIASLLAYFASQRADIKLFAFLKTRFKNAPLAMRGAISTMCAQLLDTLLFSFLGLYGLVHNVLHVIVLSYCIKLITIFFFSSFFALFKKTFVRES